MTGTALSLQAALHSKGMGGAMKPIDQRKQARMIVSDRLRLFFSQLREELAAGTEELWKRVENKRIHPVWAALPNCPACS